MPEPLALISADWHVRKLDRVWYRRDALWGDTEWGIQQVLALAEEHDLRDILLLGDLFEQKLQQSDALLTMRQALDTCQRQERAVHFIQGQHERAVPTLLSALHSWPTHMHGDFLRLAPDIVIYFLDYQIPALVREALEGVPAEANVLATHQVWKDFLGHDRGDAWFADVPDSVEMIITGDFHKTLVKKEGRQMIVSPGPLCMQNIGEPPDKYALILNDDLSITRLALRSRGYYQARLHSQEELDAFIAGWLDHPARRPQQGVPANIATNLLRVWYLADLPEAKKRLETTVGQAAHLFLSPIPVATTQQAADTTRRQHAVLRAGLTGCITEFYADDVQVRDDAVRLANTRDIQTEITDIFKEHMNGPDPDRKGPLQDATSEALACDTRPA